MLKVDAYEIFICNADVGYLPSSEMGHMAMLHYKFTRFPFDRGLDDESLCLGNLFPMNSPSPGTADCVVKS